MRPRRVALRDLLCDDDMEALTGLTNDMKVQVPSTASVIAQAFFRASPSLKRVAIHSVVERRSRRIIPCFVRSDDGVAKLEGFDILTDRSWREG
jgi:hypothetical protein